MNKYSFVAINHPLATLLQTFITIIANGLKRRKWKMQMRKKRLCGLAVIVIVQGCEVHAQNDISVLTACKNYDSRKTPCLQQYSLQNWWDRTRTRIRRFCLVKTIWSNYKSVLFCVSFICGAPQIKDIQIRSQKVDTVSDLIQNDVQISIFYEVPPVGSTHGLYILFCLMCRVWRRTRTERHLLPDIRDNPPETWRILCHVVWIIFVNTL